jgi:hypothetical protein
LIVNPCCPVVKALVLAGAVGLLGFFGWKSSTCCEQSPGVSLPRVETPDVAEACGTCCGGKKAALTASPGDEACCEPAAPVLVSAGSGAGWGSIKGQVIFGGGSLPKPEEEKVTSDQQHCLAKGPILNKVWDVNPESKGLANIVVFVVPARNEELPVHDSLAGTPSPFILDQPYCVFTPRVFAVRKGQTITAKNPDPVAHNVVIKGIKNDQNVQIPPGAEKQLTLEADTNAMTVSCGSHPWMRGYAWCFDHPYFAVTDKDGKFEIKNVPAGARKIAIWHETGYLPGYTKREAKAVTVNDGAVVDLGQIPAMPR